jgi:hypothetical protein
MFDFKSLKLLFFLRPFIIFLLVLSFTEIVSLPLIPDLYIARTYFDGAVILTSEGVLVSEIRVSLAAFY